MKRTLCLGLLLFMVQSVTIAQKINIYPGKELIKKVNREGLKVTINMDEKKVARAWEDFLRDFGKVESSKKSYTVEAAKVPSLSKSPIRIISTIDSEKDNTTLFYAIDLGSEYVTQQSPVYQEAENFLRSFVRKLYEDEIAEQVKEAEKSLATAIRRQERAKQEGDNLTKAIERNKVEKESLEKKLTENKATSEKLAKETESNKKDQALTTAEVEKNKKIVEEIKQKYSLVE